MATQVYLFSKPDIDSNLETFYLSILELSNDVEELKEVNGLLAWWIGTVKSFLLSASLRSLPFFRQVFPNHTAFCHFSSAKSALGIVKAKQKQFNSASANSLANGGSREAKLVH